MIGQEPSNIEGFEQEIESALFAWRPVLSFTLGVNSILILSEVSFRLQPSDSHVLTLLIFAAPAMTLGGIAGWLLPWFVGLRLPVQRSLTKLATVLSCALWVFLLADHHMGFRYSSVLLAVFAS